jgi:dinuclear metal center YbgI/SA1388 family protein
MKLTKIIESLEKWAPPILQQSYDNCGLLVGSKKNNINGCIISLDCTEDVIDEAIKKRCNLVISHHPLIFNPLNSINEDSWIGKTIIKAIKNDINIYALHTNLDNVISGVNKKISDLLKLKNISILNNFIPTEENKDEINKLNLKNKIGSGIIGDRKISLKDLFKELKEKFNNKIFKHTEEINKNVSKIAICGGSGNFLIKKAIDKNADVLITSDLKYHDYFMSENKIVLIDIGHYESEQHTKDLIFEYLNKKLTNIALHLSNVDTNPVKYF